MKNLYKLGNLLIIVLILCLVLPTTVKAGGGPPSNPVLGDGDWNNCGPDTYYDTGGAGSDYSNSESITETYCTDVAGDCIQFVFTVFNTESCCDDLNIYDGPNTGSPLIGSYNGTILPNGGTITSTTGCLTFEWTSDGSIIRPGWEATFSCVTCPTCTDGILNGSEIGIDCGGPTCPACPCASLPVFNDEACCATPVTVNPNASCGSVTAGTVANATPSFNGNTCFGTDDDDVWFSFVATNATHYIDLLNISGSVTDMYFAVYGGTCNATGASLVCSDPNSTVLSGLTIGNTYFIRVYTYTSTGGQNTTFDVCVGSPPPPPANDEPCNAIPAVVNPTAVCTSITSGWTVGATQTLAGCAGTANDDVWFSFVALSASQDILLSNATGTTDLVHQLFSGTCGSLTSLGCSDPNSSSWTGLTVGATYFVRVYTYSSSGINTGFDLCITSPCGIGGTAPTCNLNYTASVIAHSPYNYNQGTILAFPDDRFANSYSSIGFDFCFDGVIYTDVLVSSNGYIIFPSCYSTAPGGTVAPTQYSAYSISAAIPNTTNAPTNAILGTWQDIDPGVSGTIRTRIEGVAPNRVFVTKYDDIAMFSCNALKYSGQIMLYETTSDIEIHITEKTICSTWNGGDAIMGLHNFDGTIAVTNAAHNYPTNWAETNRAYKFTNNCPPCTVLPVELVEFDAIAYNGYNMLNWKTVSEINNAYFVVEKSDGGPTFKEIAIITGGGNSNEILNYNHKHNNPDELEYYRLKQVDFDGKFEYSKIIAVSAKRDITVNIYPNPSKNNLFFSLSESNDDTYTVVYTSVLGSVLKEHISISEGTNSYQVNEFSRLTSGIYFVQILNGADEVIKTQKIIKE